MIPQPNQSPTSYRLTEEVIQGPRDAIRPQTPSTRPRSCMRIFWHPTSTSSSSQSFSSVFLIFSTLLLIILYLGSHLILAVKLNSICPLLLLLLT